MRSSEIERKVCISEQIVQNSSKRDLICLSVGEFDVRVFFMGKLSAAVAQTATMNETQSRANVDDLRRSQPVESEADCNGLRPICGRDL